PPERRSSFPHLVRPLLTLPSFLSHATAPTEIYTLSLHDALPISSCRTESPMCCRACSPGAVLSSMYCAGSRSCWRATGCGSCTIDRKSTRLNSSHVKISYAVFCLKKKRTREKGTKKRSEDRTENT